MKILTVCLLCLAVSASAQTTTRKLQWTQSDAVTVADAQALVYTLTIDTRTPVVVVQTCALVGTVVTCTTPLAALGSGKHTLILQVDNGFDAAVATLSGASPSVPSNVKIAITITVP